MKLTSHGTDHGHAYQLMLGSDVKLHTIPMRYPD